MINYHFKLVFQYVYIQIYLVRKKKEVRLYYNVICIRCIMDCLKNFDMKYFTWKHQPNSFEKFYDNKCTHETNDCLHNIDFIHLNCKYSHKNKHWVEEIFSFVKNLLKIQFIRRISIKNENPQFNKMLLNFTFFEFVQSTFSNKVNRIPLKNLADSIQKIKDHKNFIYIQNHLNVFFEFFFDIFLTKIDIQLTSNLNSNDVIFILFFLITEFLHFQKT